MVYQDQSASGLRLNLVEGDLSLDQFSIVKQMVCVENGIEVEAMIIGASHVVTFRYGDFVWHEVFACCDIKAGSKILHCGPLVSLAGRVELVLRDEFNYQFQLDVVKGEQAKHRTDLMEGAACQTEESLVFDFPQGNLPHSPKTIVIVGGIRTVRINTAHFYPNEEIAVLTTTFFSRRR